MRQFHTVVLERLKEVEDTLETEPYEVGWADEAILFVTLSKLAASKGKATVHLQVSADGINWVDEGTSLEPIEKDGTSFMRTVHFGGWLRARFTVTEAVTSVVLTTQLVLKG